MPILPPLRPTVKCQTVTLKTSALHPSRGLTPDTRLSLPQAVKARPVGQLPGRHSIYLTVQLSRQVRVTKCVSLNTYITYPLSKMTNYWEFLLEINSTTGLLKTVYLLRNLFIKLKGEKKH